jgi:hypothetical protein
MMEDELNIESMMSDVSEGLGFDTEAADDNDVQLEIDPPAGTPPAPAPAPAPTAAAPTPPAGTPPAAPTPPAATTTTPPAPGANEPPRTWRPEAAAEWAAVPPKVQAEILKREQDMFQGLETYKADAVVGKSVNSVLSPYMPILKQFNIDPVQQIGSLMQAHHTLATGAPEQKEALFRNLARDYGVDLGKLAGMEPAYVDPTVSGLQKDVQTLRSELSARQAADHQAAIKREAAVIDAFAADPANVHFQTVANDMVAILESKQASSLKDAYEKAIWLNPVSRAAEIARQQTEQAAKAKEEEAAKAAAAKAATAANVRTRAKSGSAAAPTGSMDDTLSETLAKIKARG